MSFSHGMTGTRLYRIWKSMRTRCNNPNRKQYGDYGGRGISICSEWDDFQVFYDWAIVNGYNEDLTIERIDNNKGYCPENCKWATRKEQCNNQRRSIRVVYCGKEYTPHELSELTGISVNTIYDAHKNQHIKDFTDYVPRHGKVKNITKRKYSYELNLNGKYCGTFKTLDEAIRQRDLLLSRA